MEDMLKAIAMFELGLDEDYIINNIETYKGKTYEQLFSGDNFDDTKKNLFDTDYYHGEMINDEIITSYIAIETRDDKTLVIRDS